MSENSYKERIKVKDRLYANFLSCSSAVAVRLPEKVDFTIDHNDPNMIRRRWWHVGSPNSYTPAAQWLTFNKDDSAFSILPKNFQISAIIRIDKEIMDRELSLRGPNARPAMTYKLGTTVMAGYSVTEQSILGLDPEDDSYYQVAMGVGGGTLFAGAAVVSMQGLRKIYTPLSEGLVPGEIVPKNDLPNFIPNP